MAYRNLNRLFDQHNLKRPEFHVISKDGKWQATCGKHKSALCKKQKEALEDCAQQAWVTINQLPQYKLPPIHLPCGYKINPPLTNKIEYTYGAFDIEWDCITGEFVCASLGLDCDKIYVFTDITLLTTHLNHLSTLIVFGGYNDKKNFPSFFQGKNVIDVQNLLPRTIFNSTPGLKRAIHYYFHQYLDKSYQKSFYVKQPLTWNQFYYSALDAYAILKLYCFLVR